MNGQSPGQCAPVAPELTQQDTVSEYITILAHDLRNYLTPVAAHLTMLHTRAQREQRAVDMQAAACGRQALETALALMTNVLDAVRLERGVFDLTLHALDLSAIITHAATIFTTNSLPIRVCAPTMLIMRADGERVRQAVHNLLANAITYAPRGTTVTLDLGVEHRAGGAWAVMRIHNEGPGIPAHLLPHLFERFNTGPDSHGIGLGLYLARGIANAHGGTLTVHSDDEAGVCFILMLPR